MTEDTLRWDAVIADDEPAAREVVAGFLADHPEIRVVAEATNGRDAVDAIRRTRPDLLFLDVQMPDLDGFGVLEDLGRDVPRGIIFVTAYDEHALRAFEVHALDYVLKPFGRGRFDRAVRQAVRRLGDQDVASFHRTLASVLEARHASPAMLTEHDPALPTRIAVRNGARTLFVDVADVEWVEADGDYVRLHTRDRAYLLLERMHVMEARLDPCAFCRIHRSSLVNLRRTRELQRMEDGGGILVLESGARLRVARGRRAAVEAALVGDA